MRLDDNKIHIFGARRANVTGLGARKPRAEELALPMSAESGDLGLNIKSSLAETVEAQSRVWV